jgi:hypothetical protein
MSVPILESATGDVCLASAYTHLLCPCLSACQRVSIVSGGVYRPQRLTSPPFLSFYRDSWSRERCRVYLLTRQPPGRGLYRRGRKVLRMAWRFPWLNYSFAQFCHLHSSACRKRRTHEHPAKDTELFSVGLCALRTCASSCRLFSPQSPSG